MPETSHYRRDKTDAGIHPISSQRRTAWGRLKVRVKSSLRHIEGQRFRHERCRLVVHVEFIFSKPANMPAGVGTESGRKLGRDRKIVSVHRSLRLGQVGDIGEHDGIGNQAGIFDLLFLFDRIATFDDGAAKGDPVEEIIERFDLCGFSADRAPDIGIVDIAQQKQCALYTTEFSEGLI